MNTNHSDALDGSQSAKIALADRAQIENALSRLAGRTSSDWLPATNKYRVDTFTRIRDDHQAAALDFNAFTEYLAASAVVHCGDAWGYLGRAIDATLRGDNHSAVHLAYYAELRGALSLLAGEGMYIGNGYNCVVGPGKSVELITRQATHKAVWAFVDAWIDTQRSYDLLAKVIRPGGTTLDEWLGNGSLGGGTVTIRELLRQLAFDIQSFAHDRDRRNSASYEGTRICPDDMSIGAVSDLVNKLWESLEPDSAGSFPVVDREILGQILVNTFRSVRPVASPVNFGKPGSQPTWEAWLATYVPNQHVEQSLHTELKAHAPDSPLEWILQKAFEFDGSATEPSAYLESMLFRTVVLLRISTGATLDLIDRAGLKQSDVDLWRDPLAVSRGLWAPNSALDDPLDLWTDTADALDTLGRTDIAGAHSFLMGLAGTAITLGQAERVVAWSFAS